MNIEQQLAELAVTLESSNMFDFEIHSFEGSRLILVGCFDLAYCHEIELRFDGTSYLSLPTQFSFPKIRVGTSDEKSVVGSIVTLHDEDNVFHIEAETTLAAPMKHSFFVVAEKFSFHQGMVYHYEREDLQKDEKIDNLVLRRRRSQEN